MSSHASPRERLDALADEFSFLDSWSLKYDHLIDLGSEVPVLAPEFRNPDHLFSACTAPIWVRLGLAEGRVRIEGWCDAAIPKGLLGLLVHLFQGASPAEITEVRGMTAPRLGLDTHLSPTRARAFQLLESRLADLALGLASTTAPQAEPAPRARFEGIQKLYGAAGLARLQSSTVAVVGLGGVGSWAAEALARSAVGTLVLIDRDEVCLSNTNRQVPALEGNYARLKAEALAERLALINPDLDIRIHRAFLEASNVDILLDPKPDWVIDAIDSVPDKAVLFDWCKRHQTGLAISGASGGKTDPTCVTVTDLGLEHNDPLLKSLKRRIEKNFDFTPSLNHRKRPLYGVQAVWSSERAQAPWDLCDLPPAGGKGPDGGIDCGGSFGSASFLTGTFGFTLASLAVRTLAGGTARGAAEKERPA